MNGINLLPKQLKDERKQAQLNFRISAICFAILGIFVLGLVGLEAANQILSLSLKTSQTQIQFEEQEIAKLKDIDLKAKKINDTLATINNLEKNQVLWPKLLQSIAASTPSALQINSLAINSKTLPNFTIYGIAATRREIAKFKEKLESISFLKNVIFVSSTQAENPKGVVFNFNLQAEFENKR